MQVRIGNNSGFAALPWWQRVLGALVLGLALLVCLPVVLLAAPFWALSRLRDMLRRRQLVRQAIDRWQGRRLLLVYSDSPVWKDYVEGNWLPKLADVAVTLNWSARERWKAENPFEAQVFRQWAGAREFNPVAIAFMPGGHVEVIRFWKAFRDFKHGKPGRLKDAESRLDEAVAAIRSGSGPEPQTNS